MAALELMASCFQLQAHAGHVRHTERTAHVPLGFYNAVDENNFVLGFWVRVEMNLFIVHMKDVRTEGMHNRTMHFTCSIQSAEPKLLRASACFFISISASFYYIRAAIHINQWMPPPLRQWRQFHGKFTCDFVHCESEFISIFNLIPFTPERFFCLTMLSFRFCNCYFYCFKNFIGRTVAFGT